MFGLSLKHRDFSRELKSLKEALTLLSVGRSNLNASSHPISKRKSGTEDSKAGSYPDIKNYLLTWKMYGIRYIYEEKPFLHHYRDTV